MKRWFLIASLILAMVPSVLHATDGTFIWDGVKIVPPDVAPQIDAFNVINNGTMSI